MLAFYYRNMFVTHSNIGSSSVILLSEKDAYFIIPPFPESPTEINMHTFLPNSNDMTKWSWFKASVSTYVYMISIICTLFISYI